MTVEEADVRHSGHTYLTDNAQRFSEFLHSAKVSIITVAVLADGNVELDLGKIWNQYDEDLECAPRHTYHMGRLFSGPISRRCHVA